MVKNILLAFIENADRNNAMTLIPWCLDFIDSSDAQFETASSGKIQTLQLFYQYDKVTYSIGLVFYHNQIYGGKIDDDLQNRCNSVGPCHQMLKKALKLDQVHTFGNISVSQLVEKFDFVTERVLFNELKKT